MNKLKQENSTQIKYFISMDLTEKEGDIYSETELVEKGNQLIKEGNREFLDAKIDNEKWE